MKNSVLTLFLSFLLGVLYSQPNTWVQKSNFGGGGRSFAVSFAIGSKGYILTGGSNTSVTNDLWEYDTLTNIWTQKTSFPGDARETAVAFSIGSKGYIGTGKDWSGTFYNDFWEYNPSTDTWTQKANFGGVGRYSAVGFSIGDKGYIGTGAENGFKHYDFWEYDTTLNTWTQKANLPGAERYGAVGFSIGNKGYIGGGQTSGVADDFYEYDPTTNTWTQKADILVPGALYASGFSVGSFGFVHTDSGSNFGGYDPNTDTWVMLENLPISRDQAVGFTIGNKGYIGTGYNNGRLNDLWCYTPCTSFPTASITVTGPTTFCSGDSVVLTASSGDSYMWWNGQTTQSITVFTSGPLAVQITSSCGTVESDQVIITALPTPPVPVITQFDSLLTSSSLTNNQWYFNGSIMPGETNQSCVATYLGEYSVVVTNPNGCSNSGSFTYTGNPNFLSVPICLVTVDSSSQYNIIVWDKTSVYNVDTFIVLREISTNNYQPIAAIPFDSLSQFKDTVRTLYFPNTGDPNFGTYRYKMQCVDINGLYSSSSAYHNTIFFINNGGVFNLLQAYEIENEPNPVSSYVLMRDDLSNGNWHDIASVAGTQTFIIDPMYSTYQNTASWRVRTEWSISCTASKSGYNNSFSNVYNSGLINIDNSYNNDQVEIYPNPTNGKIFLNTTKVETVEIIDLQGKQIYSGIENTIDISQEPKGLYIIKVRTSNGVTVGKIVLE